MKIYTVVEFEPYEADICHGFYTTKAAAEAKAEEVRKTFSAWRAKSCSLDVEEIEVEE